MLILNITIIIIILILVNIVAEKNFNKKIQMSKTKQENNFALLLTSYNIKDRQNMTLDIINYYINDLKFPKSNLYLVDSSNNGVSNDIIPEENQIIFDQNDTVLQIHPELLSLLKCCNMFNKYDYIFKLTCKYKLKKLIYIKFPLNYDFIIQNNNSSLISRLINKWTSSEIVGFNAKKMPQLIKELISLQDIMFEKTLYKAQNKKKYIILPRLENEAHYKRCNGSYLKFL